MILSKLSQITSIIRKIKEAIKVARIRHLSILLYILLLKFKKIIDVLLMGRQGLNCDPAVSRQCSTAELHTQELNKYSKI